MDFRTKFMDGVAAGELTSRRRLRNGRWLVTVRDPQTGRKHRLLSMILIDPPPIADGRLVRMVFMRYGWTICDVYPGGGSFLDDDDSTTE